MKKILLLVLAGVILTSCEKEPVKDYLVLSGKIDNFKKRTIDLQGFNFEKKIRFDRKTGTFVDTLKNIIPGHYTLILDKRPINLYLSSTEDTKVSVDVKKRTEDPVFEGPNASINNYLDVKRKKFGLILGNAQKFFSLEENDFLAKAQEYEDELVKLAENSNLPEAYLEMEKRNLHHEYVRNLSNYQNYYRTLSGNDEFVVSENFPFEKEVAEFDFNNSTDYINSYQYRKFLVDHLEKVATAKTPEGGDFYLTNLETIQTEVLDTLIKNDVIHNLAQNGVTYTMDLHEFYKKYMAYSTNEGNKKEITDLYEKLKLTASGQPSPKFENFENYKGGTTSFDDLLGHGKYLYIDVWATWCGFCKKEIPLLKHFENKYHGKNIEFVSINVDTQDKKNKWKETIEEKEMGGVQLFAGDKHENIKFAQDYLIKGLPRFIIVDPEGKIVTANAPRPSDAEQLDEIFEELGI